MVTINIVRHSVHVSLLNCGLSPPPPPLFFHFLLFVFYIFYNNIFNLYSDSAQTIRTHLCFYMNF